MQFIDEHEPEVVAMGPPCGSMACWSRLNRRLHPETFERQRAIGEHLAAIAARIANRQSVLIVNRVLIQAQPISDDISIFLKL